MGKVRDKMDAAIREKRTFFSFEFFPPRTPEVSSPSLCSGHINSSAGHRFGGTLRPGRLLQPHVLDVVLPMLCTDPKATFSSCRV